MKKRRLLIFLSGILATLVLTLGLRGVAPVAAQASGGLMISAAISLQNALEAIDPQAEQAIGAGVNYNFAASGALQQQIEQGAPADVFISAASRQMDALQQKGLITRSPSSKTAKIRKPPKAT